MTGAGSIDVLSGIARFNFPAGVGSLGGTITGSGDGTLEVLGNFTFESSSTITIPHMVFGGVADKTVEGSYGVSGSTTFNSKSVTFTPTATILGLGSSILFGRSPFGGVVNGGTAIFDLKTSTGPFPRPIYLPFTSTL